MNKDEILSTILNDSQKLAVHFLELLPEGKVAPQSGAFDPFEFDISQNFHLGWGGETLDVLNVTIIDPESFFRIIFDDRTYGKVEAKWYDKGKGKWFPFNFTLESTEIPQAVLDLIPDKE